MRTYKGVCFGGPLDGQEVSHDAVHIAFSDGNYEYCSTREKTWLWLPMIRLDPVFSSLLPGHDETTAALNALTIRKPTCSHVWRDVDSQSDNAVKCTKCDVPGERQRDGSVYWPAT